MGSSVSCFSCSSSNPKITRGIKLQREVATLYNDVIEREDRLMEIWVNIEQLEKHRVDVLRENTRRRLEEQRRESHELVMKKVLERRKELLLKVIAVGLQVQDRQQELATSEQNYSKFWSLTYEDDPEEQREEWKQDMRRTFSQNDMDKAVPRPPLVSSCNDIAVFFYYCYSDCDVMIDHVTVHSSMDGETDEQC